MKTNAPQSKKRPTRLGLRRLLIAIVAMAVLVILAPMVLVPWIGKGLVASTIEDELGGRARIEGLSGGWWTPVRITKLELDAPETGATWLSAEAVTLSENLWGLAMGSGPIEGSVKGARVALVRAPDGRPALPPGVLKQKDPRPATDPDAPSDSPIPDSGTPLFDRDLKLGIDAEVTIAGEARIRVQGDARLLSGNQLTAGLELRTAGSGQISLRAEAVPDEQKQWALDLALTANKLPHAWLEAWARPWMRDLKSGNIDELIVSANGGLNSGLEIAARWRLSDLAVHGEGETLAAAPAESMRGHLKGRLHAHGLRNGSAGLSGGGLDIDVAEGLTIDWEDALEIRAEARASIPEGRKLNPFLPSGIRLAGSLAGDLRIAGRLPASSEPSIEDWLRGFENSQVQLQATKLSTGSDRPEIDSVDLRMNIAGGQLVVEKGSVRAGPSRIEVGPGRIHPAELAASSPLPLSVKALDLSDWIAGDAGLQGVLDLALTVQADPQGWRLSGQSQIAGFEFALDGEALQSDRLTIKADLRSDAKASQFHLRSVELTDAQGQLQVQVDEGRIDLHALDQSRAKLEATLSASGWSALSRTLKLPSIEAAESLSLQLQVGPHESGGLVGALVARLPQLDTRSLVATLPQVQPSRLEATLGWSDEEQWITGLQWKTDGLEFHLDQLRRAASGQLQLDTAWRLESSGETLTALIPSLGLSPGWAATGPCSVRGRLQGPLDPQLAESMRELQFEATLEGPALTAEGHTVEAWSVALHRTGDRAQLTGSADIDGGMFQLKGQLPIPGLTSNSPVFLKAEAQGLPLAFTQAKLGAPASSLVTRSRAGIVLQAGFPEGYARIPFSVAVETDPIVRTFTRSGPPQSQTLPGMKLQLTGTHTAATGTHIDHAGCTSADAGKTLTWNLQGLSLQPPYRFERTSGRISPSALSALLLGQGAQLTATEDLEFHFNSKATADAQDPNQTWAAMEGAGQLSIGRMTYDGIPIGPGRLPLRLEQGRLVPQEELRIPASGGELIIGANSSYDLRTGDASKIQVRLDGVQLQRSLAPALGLAHPMFLIGARSQDSIAGNFDAEVDINLSAQEGPWWQGVNGQIRIEFAAGQIVGSQLLGNLAQGLAGSSLGGLRNNPLTLLTGRGFDPSQALSPLALSGFEFPEFALDLRLEAGVLQLAQPIPLKIGEFTFTLNGSARLDGELDYRLGTDVLERLARKALAKSGGGSPLNQLFGVISPLRQLLGQSLGASIRGNAFSAEGGALEITPAVGR